MENLINEIEAIKTYLLSIEGVNNIMVESLLKPYYDNLDIAKEFEYWIKTKEFVLENCVIEQGYSAKRINDEFGDLLKPSGIFSLLITLRNEPEKGLKYIKNNFPTK